MSKPRIGLITFGDNREHEWKHVFQKMTEPYHKDAVAFLEQLPVELVVDENVARTRDEINAQVDFLRSEKVDALVAHTPCWTSPNLVVHGVQRLGLPTIVLGNKHPGTHSTVGLLGAGGTLSQIGFPHIRIREDFSKALIEKVMPFFRASLAKTRLPGKQFGLFGGRSLGIDTGTYDPMQWKQLFGIDSEHIDQLEIVRRAEMVSKEESSRMVRWLERSVGKVAYDDEKLLPEKLDFQARCYLATVEIILEHGLDFVAIKCMPDMTNHYVPQCLSAALLPGPYDADGLREPVMMACEADADAALSMEILKEISGGLPVLFMDVSYIDDDEGVFYFPNCGAFCSWYAGRSGNPEENLRKVELRPANRPAGGAITYFTAAPGPLTLARLYRVEGKYRMMVISAETVEIPDEQYTRFVEARGSHQLPTAFMRMDVDIDELISEFGSNHIMGVAGNFMEELRHFCKLMDIELIQPKSKTKNS
jgi:L-fucose isomerase